MGLLKIRGGDARLIEGGDWVLEVASYDTAGYLDTATAPTVTLTLPDGMPGVAPVMSLSEDGALTWVGRYTVTDPGRYLAVVATATDAEGFTAWVAEPVDATGLPTVELVVAYLEADGTTYDEDAITRALAAESQAQRNCCRMPATYPADLAEALYRRVARNLAMQSLPLGTARADDGSSSGGYLPAQDPEVRRYERPYRKVVTG